MPTYQQLPSFTRDLSLLSIPDRARFLEAVERFVTALQAAQLPPPGLRVKRVRGFSGVWEMTWAPDGRATFMYGAPVNAGQAHVIWRRIGTHAIFGRP